MSEGQYGRQALTWREAEDTLAAFTEEQLDETVGCGSAWIILGELTATIAALRAEVKEWKRVGSLWWGPTLPEPFTPAHLEEAWEQEQVDQEAQSAKLATAVGALERMVRLDEEDSPTVYGELAETTLKEIGEVSGG